MNLFKDLLSQIRSSSGAYGVPVELWPDAVTVSPRQLECGNGVSQTFLLSGYPSELPAAWLESLITAASRVDCAIHVDAVDNAIAANQLRKRRARLESSRRYTANRDRLDDPSVEAAAADAADMAGRLARGDTRLFSIGVYITVHALDSHALSLACDQVHAAATAAMMDIRPATFRQLPAITSTLPIGLDALSAVRTVDTDVAAAAFPFTSPDAPDAPQGVLYGLNLSTGSPVMWDRWDCDNHNSVVVARSGAGKSYFTKTEVLRQLYSGVDVTVVDPDGEYHHLAAHVGGTTCSPGAPGVHLNPLALPHDPGPDALTRRIMFIHNLVSTLLHTTLTPDESAVLDDAVLTAYTAHGITANPATWHQAPPHLGHVCTALTGSGSPIAATLATRLAPYVTGGLSDLFTGEPTKLPTGHLTVYNLAQLPDELTSAGTLLVLDAIWRSLADDGTRRLIVVDEAWLLLRHGAGATFMSRLAKAARKRRAGLMTVTQDAEDMLSTDLGRVVIANAATQILLRQAPQTIDTVTEAFKLSRAERDLLLTARRGEALLICGDTRVAFAAVTSPDEHELCLTGISTQEEQ